MTAARSMKDTLPDGLFRHTDPETSREAARSIVPHITAIQATVLREVRDAGSYGMTDFELEQRLGNTSATLRSRRAELVAKDLIRDSGERRKVGGSNRTVWVAV